jgi:hypothetical protein
VTTNAQPARSKVLSRQDGPWLQNPSKWLSSAVTMAFRDLHREPFMKSSWAASHFMKKTREPDQGDDYYWSA